MTIYPICSVINLVNLDQNLFMLLAASLMPVKFSYSLSQLRKLCGCRVPLVKFDKRNERGADVIDPSLFAQFGKIPSEGCK